MMCYRDMTFCKHYEGCRDGLACHRALTPAVQAGANAWWGEPGAPIATFIEQPNCFIKTIAVEIPT